MQVEDITGVSVSHVEMNSGIQFYDDINYRGHTTNIN